MDFDVLDKDARPRKREVQMASSLVEQMPSELDPSEFEDEYANKSGSTKRSGSKSRSA